jgi:hypothetical protein
MDETSQTMDQVNRFSNEENQALEEERLKKAVFERLMTNITRHAGLYIPQRRYCQGFAMPEGVAPQNIMFAMTDGACFPAQLALDGQCGFLVDAGGIVFAGTNHTIEMRIEVFGPCNPRTTTHPIRTFSGLVTTGGEHR